MKQPIAGVAPSELEEVTTMIVWPSIAATWAGRKLGELYSIKWPNIYIFRIGNLFALISIPIALALYFYRLKPCVLGIPLYGVFYRLTNRRVMVLRNEINFQRKFPFLRFQYGAEAKSVELDRFDEIDLVRHPGQAWFDAGDLVFKLNGVETFRLDGVSRPEAFRTTLMNSRRSYVGVKTALTREAVPA